MKQFEISAKSNSRDFELSENGGFVGALNFIKWSSEKATIKMGSGGVYTFNTKSFWKATAQVLEGERELFEIKNNFSGGATLIPFKEEHHFYTIKARGWFSNSYSLLSYKGEELAVIKSEFSWKGFETTYNLNCNENFGNTEREQLLLLLLVQHYRAMQRAAVAVATS